MEPEYTRHEMIEILTRYLKEQGFEEPSEYSTELGNIRLPLYCAKRLPGEVHPTEEVVVDIITERIVSKETHLPNLIVGGLTVENASAARFFQFYFHRAKVFLAYGAYVERDAAFEAFKAACTDSGIGLLEISDGEATEILPAMPLSQIVSDEMKADVDKMIKGELTNLGLLENLSGLVETHQEDYIKYLVYYGDPQFQRREITGRVSEDLSILLIDSLQELASIDYADELKLLGSQYRQKTASDYDIALATIKSLWSSRLGIEYPDIQKDFEPVLLLNPDYRDHFLHQFQVFLIGVLIVDKLHETDPIRGFESSYGATFEDAWLAASTYHDFNYLIEECEVWMRRFFARNLHINDCLPIELNLEKFVIRDELFSKMERLCQAIGCDLDDRVMRFLLERVAVRKNHAVLGSLSFLKKFQDNERLAPAAVSHAAASILLHDDRNWRCFCGQGIGTDMKLWESELCAMKLIPRLEFSSKPLVFLLTFCDAVQAWGRFGRGYERTKAMLEKLEINPEAVLIDVSVEDPASLSEMQDAMLDLQTYLVDKRFIVKIRSRSGAAQTEIPMSGTVRKR